MNTGVFGTLLRELITGFPDFSVGDGVIEAADERSSV
jgi:hypothetical protein